MPTDQRVRLPLIVELLAAGAGLAAYAYAAGGIVEYLRFAGEDLPAGQAVALLSSRQLLVVGVLIVLMCVPLWLGTRGVVWLWDRVQEKYGGGRPPRAERGGKPLPTSEAMGTGGALAAAAALTFAVLSLLTDTESGGDLVSLANSIGVATAAGAILGSFFALLGATWRQPFGWSDVVRLPGRWLAAVLLTVALAGGASFAYFTPLATSRAVIQMQDGRCMTGPYLSRDSEGVHLIDGPSKTLYTVLIRDMAGIQIGGSIEVADEAVDFGPCPSAALSRTARPKRG